MTICDRCGGIGFHRGWCPDAGPDVASSPAGRADTGNIGLREAIVRTLYGWTAVTWREAERQEMADALLSGPLAPLIADSQAMQRVRRLLEAWETKAQPASNETKVHALRRALDPSS
jgi:hypothetical protein